LQVDSIVEEDWIRKGRWIRFVESDFSQVICCWFGPLAAAKKLAQGLMGLWGEEGYLVGVASLLHIGLWHAVR